MMVMTNPTADDLAKLGYRVVMSGELGKLRDKVGITLNAQAKLIGVDAESLPKWENMRRAMNIETAVRIGEWYWAAVGAIEDGNVVDFKQLVPESRAAQHFGVPIAEVAQTAKDRKMKHEDLGVLGVFIYRSEFTASIDY